MKYFFWTVLVLLAVSCAGKNNSKDSQVSLKLSNIVNGTALDGGISILSISSLGIKKVHDLDSTHTIIVEKGSYNFFAVGWTGPTRYFGNSYCGSSLNQLLEIDEQAISLTLSQSNCFVPEIQFVLKHQLDHMDIQIDGTQTGQLLGSSISDAGDVNADGVNDFIVGAMSFDGSAGIDSGKAVVFSGKDYSVLYSIEGEIAGDLFGTSVDGAGDFNSDGHDDFIVGAKDASSAKGKIYIYSGANGSILYTQVGAALGDDFGYSVSGLGDYNQDGYDDVVVGAPLENTVNGTDSGKIYIISGPSGSSIHTVNGEVAGDKLGMTVANAGDFNGDGYPDALSSAELFDNGGITNVGKVYVISGINNSILFSVMGEAASDFLGKGLASAGDINADGYDDIIVGAPGNDTGGISRGKVYVYSGFDQSLLYSKVGSVNSDQLGAKVAGNFDYDGDGVSDFAIAITGFDGLAGTNTGKVEIISGGATQTILHSTEGAVAGDLLGNTGMAGLKDANGDGKSDLIIGAGSSNSGDGAFLIR